PRLHRLHGADAGLENPWPMSRVSAFPGISLVTSSGGPPELAEAARLAEEAGFASVWATEFYDRSATVALAAMAQATNTIELGSAIAYAFGRTPLVLAAAARDL